MTDAREDILKLLKAQNEVLKDRRGAVYNIAVSEFLYPSEEQTKKFLKVAMTQTGEYKLSGIELNLIKKMLGSKEFKKVIAAEELAITDFGCGNGVKAYTIINALPKQIKNVVYFPLDISQYMINNTTELIKKCKGFDSIEIHRKGEESPGFTKQVILREVIDYEKILNSIIEELNILFSFENYKNFRSKILEDHASFLKNLQIELPKLQVELEEKELLSGAYAAIRKTSWNNSLGIFRAELSYLVKNKLQGDNNEMKSIFKSCEKHVVVFINGLNEFISYIKKHLGEKKEIRRIIVTPMNLNFRNIEGIYSIIDMFSASKGKNLILFLGQTFGNFHSNERIELLLRMHRALKKNDLILIGVELLYDKRKIIASYKDRKIENFFNETIKVAGFDLDDVDYDARFNDNCVEIVFRVNKDIRIGQGSKVGEIQFKEGDEIIVAVSYKFLEYEIRNLMQAGFKIEFWPKNDEYALILCSKQ